MVSTTLYAFNTSFSFPVKTFIFTVSPPFTTLAFVPSVFVVVANTATFNATIIENAITTAKSFDTFFI